MSTAIQNRKLPELSTLERVLKDFGARASVEVLARVQHEDMEFPIHGVVLGSQDKSAPCLGLFGGVHGLERIGSEVVIAFLRTISEILKWDVTWQERLSRSRMVFVPIVNPVGMFRQRRSNGNGVDLMRNAPVEADEPPWFLLGGHTFSPHLPWYRGRVGGEAEMEIETRAVIDFVRREMFPSRLSLAIDVHSGFGAVDRLWFPFAKSKKPPPHLAEVAALKQLFDRSYPNHFYRIEPQAKQYTTHGDLWDYLYEQQMVAQPAHVFLPWTLELGSWLWLKKSPGNLFSALGAFNPVQPHRLQRILRRHLTLFDFLHRVLLSPNGWTHLPEDRRQELILRAREIWYDE
ncbi:MAG: DUF2817 domain-containing protein [Bdellovibrionaceae bacterium]|nr:DUF2817 domain-containing protein [Pseudobdellovibrionaceae bacterium]